MQPSNRYWFLPGMSRFRGGYWPSCESTSKRRELLHGVSCLKFLLGAEPVFFGGSAHKSARFRIRIGKKGHGFLGHRRGDGFHGQDFRFGRRGAVNSYSRGTRDALRAGRLAASRRGSTARHGYLILGNTVSCHIIICLLTTEWSLYRS